MNTLYLKNKRNFKKMNAQSEERTPLIKRMNTINLKNELNKKMNAQSKERTHLIQRMNAIYLYNELN